MRNPEFQSRIRGVKAVAFATGLAIAAAGCGNAEVSPVPRPSGDGITSMEFGPKQMVVVKPGDLILGDVAIGTPGTTLEQFEKDANNYQNSDNFQRNPNIVELFDTAKHHQPGVDVRKTGLITRVMTDGIVYVDGWKAALTMGFPENEIQRFIDTYKITMSYEGCINGCTEEVSPINYTGPNTIPQPERPLETNSSSQTSLK